MAKGSGSNRSDIYGDFNGSSDGSFTRNDGSRPPLGGNDSSSAWDKIEPVVKDVSKIPDTPDHSRNKDGAGKEHSGGGGSKRSQQNNP